MHQNSTQTDYATQSSRLMPLSLLSVGRLPRTLHRSTSSQLFHCYSPSWRIAYIDHCIAAVTTNLILSVKDICDYLHVCCLPFNIYIYVLWDKLFKIKCNYYEFMRDRLRQFPKFTSQINQLRNLAACCMNFSLRSGALFSPLIALPVVIVILSRGRNGTDADVCPLSQSDSTSYICTFK